MKFQISYDISVMDAEFFKNPVARMKAYRAYAERESLIQLMQGTSWHKKKGSLTLHLNKLFHMADGSLKTEKLCAASKYFCLKCTRIWKQ